MTLSSSIYYAGKPNPIQVSRQQEKSPKGLTIFAIIVCVILWASAFPAIRVALNGYTPTEVAFLRYIVASVVMTVYAIARRMPLPRVSDWSAIAVLQITFYFFCYLTHQLKISF
ncbi:MAG: EamA family transporter [Xenococcaceae cyanobacterium MO_188.B32]|nr:EamA family transporter [Xenococcaceae cyanobacterium MO_188.B32]